MSKHWKIRPYDSQQVRFLEKSASIPAVLAQLFVGRGMTQPTEVQGFMNPKLSLLRAPNELPGAQLAAQYILEAIRSNRQITVYGDYDVDGMTGTAILQQAIKLLGGHVGYYVPSRLDEGYGLNHEAIKNLAESGTQLIITVDCGISSCEEAKTAKEVGVDLIISDHHRPGPVLPDALAVVHPQLLLYQDRYLSPCAEELLQNPDVKEKAVQYPFHELSGATVALKIAWALGQLAAGEQKVSPTFRTFLLQAVGLAAMGTVADVVPLVDENRVLVRYGLDNALIEHTPLGIRELIKIAGVRTENKLTSETIGFQLAPRLNAAGRLGQAQLGVELLITDNQSRAAELAQYVNGLNESRQKLERAIQKEANQQIEEKFDLSDPAFVLASPDWHSGVIGIVAGRLSEQYHRPVVMLAQDKMGLKPATGSARGIPGFNLYNALQACCDHLIRFGGHAPAAGLGIEDSKIDLFREAFCDFASQMITEEMKTEELWIDGEFPFGVFSPKIVLMLEEMAPFGCANKRPILCTQQVYLSGPPKTMGADNRHFSATFRQDEISYRAVAFNCGRWVEQMISHGEGPYDIAFHAVINTFGGRSKVELQLVDWRLSK